MNYILQSYKVISMAWPAHKENGTGSIRMRRGVMMSKPARHDLARNRIEPSIIQWS